MDKQTDLLELHRINKELARSGLLKEEPLDDLLESIKQSGIITPLKLYEGEVLMGARRLAAAKKLKFTTIPVIESSYKTEEDARTAARESNIQRALDSKRTSPPYRLLWTYPFKTWPELYVDLSGITGQRVADQRDLRLAAAEHFGWKINYLTYKVLPLAVKIAREPRRREVTEEQKTEAFVSYFQWCKLKDSQNAEIQQEKEKIFKRYDSIMRIVRKKWSRYMDADEAEKLLERRGKPRTAQIEKYGAKLGKLG